MRRLTSVSPTARVLAAWLASFLPVGAQPVAAPRVDTNQPVRVEISIPAAQTFVIGDPTPLVWRFTNTATQALAFMWEGCCRNNGKIEMKRLGPPPPVAVPLAHNGPGPGIYSPKCDHCKQTRQLGEITVESTAAAPVPAHQFARAVRLAPGATQEFSTRLADWVKAEFTGDYRLRAQYLGVQPKQRPQMPRGAALWSGRTASSELDLSLLSVRDYLAERDARAAARQVRLELSGPARLVPFQPAPLKLKLTNSGRAEQRLDWPACLDLWLVATNGVRVSLLTEPSLGATETVVLPAGGSVEREVPFSHELFVGEPFGTYQVFVDLRETTNALRVPSNPITVVWQLDRDAVSQLVRDAAEKPITGARNEPLKLLRLYLGEITPVLRPLDTTALSPAAAKLAAELSTAAALKPLLPRPGRVDLSLRVSADGRHAFTDAALVAAFAGRTRSVAEQFGEVIALRRHLGWDVGASLKPEPDTSLRHVATALAAITPLHANLDALPSATVFNADSTAFSSLTFPPAVIPANLVLRVTKSGAAVKLAVARRLPDPQRPGVEVMFSSAELAKVEFTDLLNVAALEALLADGQLAAPRPLVLAAPNLKWQELTASLGPLLNRSLALDLVIQ